MRLVVFHDVYRPDMHRKASNPQWRQKRGLRPSEVSTQVDITTPEMFHHTYQKPYLIIAWFIYKDVK